MTSQNDRMIALRDELAGILEERLSDLTGSLLAVQEVTRQVASVDLEIRRNQSAKARLEQELTALRKQSGSLETENAEIKARVDKLKANVERMRRLREELMSGLSGLTGELKGMSGGE
jgi:chromosome segregation ATPase